VIKYKYISHRKLKQEKVIWYLEKHPEAINQILEHYEETGNFT